MYVANKTQLPSTDLFVPTIEWPNIKRYLRDFLNVVQSVGLFFLPPSVIHIFGMATMPFLCNGTLLFQGHLPRVLPVTILKYASCLIPYINDLLMMQEKLEKCIYIYRRFSCCYRIGLHNITNLSK